MDQATSQDTLTFEFDQDRKARAVIVTQDVEPGEILKKLGLEQGGKVILLAGSTAHLDEAHKERVTTLFNQGVAEAADAKTIIIDSATQEGIAELIGQSTSDLQQKPVLLGVAPLDKVILPGSQEDQSGLQPLDPNHTHFVLVRSDQWQVVARLMFDLGETLASAPPHSPPSTDCELAPPKPKLSLTMILVGDTSHQVSPIEVLTCVRRGWSLTVVEGSGGLTDEIAETWKVKERIGRQKKRWWLKPFSFFEQRKLKGGNQTLQEIVQTGKVQVFPRRAQPSEMKRVIKMQLTQVGQEQENILHQAWKRYTLYSHNAKHNQKQFYRFRNTALILAWVTTLAVLLQPFLREWADGFFGNSAPSAVDQWLMSVLIVFDQLVGSEQESTGENIIVRMVRFMIVLLPIFTTILLTAETRLKSGNKYIALRSAAEAILGGIFSYRVLACGPDTTKANTNRPKSAAELAQHLRKVSTGLVQTEITDTALKPSPETLPPSRFRKMDDDGFSGMSGEMYVRIRLLEQLNYFKRTSNRLEKTYQRYRWGIWIAGGLGTLLAAFSQEYWLPLTVGTVTVLSAFLEYQQVEQNLIIRNQSEAALANILAWWVALPRPMRDSPEILAKLLEETETVLESNHAVWVKQMQTAQEKAAEKESS
jgi:hypothetical protein